MTDPVFKVGDEVEYQVCGLAQMWCMNVRYPGTEKAVWVDAVVTEVDPSSLMTEICETSIKSLWPLKEHARYEADQWEREGFLRHR